MTIKRISKKRQTAILFEITLAKSAMERDDKDATLYALDKALKIFNGWDDSGRGTMRYDQLHDACEAFLKEAGFPSLSCLLNYIKHWQKNEDALKEMTRQKNELLERHNNLSAEVFRLNERLRTLGH
jgi:hypothetical protein